MRKFISRLLSFIMMKRFRKKVSPGSRKTIFYRSTKINLLEGAKRENIILSDHSRIHGTISVCASGIVKIGKYAQVGPGSVLRSVNSIIIGDYTAVSTNVVIVDNNSHSVNPLDRKVMQQTPMGSKERSWTNSDNAPIVIGENCWICENSRICKGVTIGDGAVVAANAVVTKDVPANSIAAGNPAKIVKTDIDVTARRYLCDKE